VSFVLLTDISLDTCGNLQGEAIVTSYIPAENRGLFWYCVGPPQPGSAIEQIDDWRIPILQLCRSPNTPGTPKLYTLTLTGPNAE